jgi:arylsulfatase A-like enzyme
MKPNIILITADEMIFDAMGCSGHRVVKTPNIDALAAGGVRFTEAFCCTPLCTPSRISMFTGRYPHAHQKFFVDQASHLEADQPSLISLLKAAGYRTGLIGKNHTFRPDFLDRWFDRVEEYHHWGKERGEMRESDRRVQAWRHHEPRERFAKFAQQGGAMVLGEGLIEGPEPFPEEECMTHRIGEDACDFIAHSSGQPFFLKLSYPDPHWPTTVCEPYYSMYAENPDVELPGYPEIDWSEHPFKHFIQSRAAGFDAYTEAERKRILATYYGMITFIDRSIGQVMEALDQAGERNNTIVVFTSDHGCFAGHFGLVGKTGGFYDSLIRIPLIVAGPGVKKGAVSRAQISNVDFCPTLLECAGIGVPAWCQGKSFAAQLADPSLPHRDAIFAEVGTPDPAPAPFPREDYDEIGLRRTEDEGWFWFVDYTTKGRSAMVRKDGWKYCYNQGDREELYDLNNDPLESFNCIDDPKSAAIKESLRRRLMDWLLVEPHRQAWNSRK